jgi:hypothetical protein
MVVRVFLVSWTPALEGNVVVAAIAKDGQPFGGELKGESPFRGEDYGRKTWW